MSRRMMESLGQTYGAVVVGASGGIGRAMAALLAADPACARLHAFSRSGNGPAGVATGRINLADEASIEAAAESVRAAGPPSLVIVATGYLHGDAGGPEKAVRQIAPAAMAHAFAVNATGPALVAKHMLPVMDRRARGVFAALSARVGSISDNRAGGWYGYRASKAALNQILRCLAIEAGRSMRQLVVAGLQPGTVRTDLSAPFRGHVAEDDLLEPETAARHLLGVLDRLVPEQSGRLFDWQGEEFAP